MSMLRNSTVKQLDRIEKEIKKQGGKLDLTVPGDHTAANGMWIHDPFEENRKGKRKIATIDDHMTIDIPESNKVLKFAEFNKINEKKIGFEKNNTPELHSGQCIELIHMEDQYSVEPGTFGVIRYIDDIGNISVKWENGRTLALLQDIDKFRILSDEECKLHKDMKKFDI